MRISDWSSDVCSSDLDAAKLLRLRLVVDMGIAAGVEFDHGRLQADRRFHLPRIGLDEQADPDIRFGEARDEGREMIMLPRGVQPALRGALLALLGDDAGGARKRVV